MRGWLIGDAADNEAAVLVMVTERQFPAWLQIAQVPVRLAVDHYGAVVGHLELLGFKQRFRHQRPIGRVHGGQLAGERGARLRNLTRHCLVLRQLVG